jgi:2-polyprenyl-3-methyl-5-hydroxy-6-metoxy-1,4-benzoquinol methylase
VPALATLVNGGATQAGNRRSGTLALDSLLMASDQGARPRSRCIAFDVAYEGTPSWETGRPQPVVVRLLEDGAFDGAVLDVGCGTGGHAVLLARSGFRVTGIDLAPAAIERARSAADEAGVASMATFRPGDVLDLAGLGPSLGAPYDSVLDCGLFHVLQPDDRRRYAMALAAVVRPGGRAFVIAWSDRNPFGVGPARVSRRELRSSFRATEGWRVESIETGLLETNLRPGTVHAWLACLRRR